MPCNPSPAWRASNSEAQKKLWRNPEHRAKMVAARRALIPEWQAHPERFSRRGVPNGWKKADALKAWAEARRLAGFAIKGFEKLGVVPSETIPDSDAEIAKLCLREACVLALGPGNDKQTKLQAINVILRFTKPKPFRRQATTLRWSAEDWLHAAIVAGSSGA
jgi:hypothetical protein